MQLEAFVEDHVIAVSPSFAIASAAGAERFPDPTKARARLESTKPAKRVPRSAGFAIRPLEALASRTTAASGFIASELRSNIQRRWNVTMVA